LENYSEAVEVGNLESQDYYEKLFTNSYEKNQLAEVNKQTPKPTKKEMKQIKKDIREEAKEILEYTKMMALGELGDDFFNLF
jgi:hypothetical protein